MGYRPGAHPGCSVSPLADTFTAWAATNFDKRSYGAIDDTDKVSCRPNFAVLIYPGGLVDKVNKDNSRPEIRVSKDTPPSSSHWRTTATGPLERQFENDRGDEESHAVSAGTPRLPPRGGHGFRDAVRNRQTARDLAETLRRMDSHHKGFLSVAA